MEKFSLIQDYWEGSESNLLLKEGDVIEGKISERGYPTGKSENGIVYMIQIGVWCKPSVKGGKILSTDDSYIESKQGNAFVLMQYLKKI